VAARWFSQYVRAAAGHWARCRTVRPYLHRGFAADRRASAGGRAVRQDRDSDGPRPHRLL